LPLGDEHADHSGSDDGKPGGNDGGNHGELSFLDLVARRRPRSGANGIQRWRSVMNMPAIPVATTARKVATMVLIMMVVPSVWRATQCCRPWVY
jgi:hypothetical protein